MLEMTMMPATTVYRNIDDDVYRIPSHETRACVNWYQHDSFARNPYAHVLFFP